VTRRFSGLACALLLAACDSKPLDWNTLAASRIRDQVPAAQLKVLDAGTLEASLGGKTTRIDTAELQLLCNRGPKDCNYAFDQVVLALRGPAGEAPR
jgi:hypothetical protein